MKKTLLVTLIISSICFSCQEEELSENHHSTDPIQSELFEFMDGFQPSSTDSDVHAEILVGINSILSKYKAKRVDDVAFESIYADYTQGFSSRTSVKNPKFIHYFHRSSSFLMR